MEEPRENEKKEKHFLSGFNSQKLFNIIDSFCLSNIRKINDHHCLMVGVKVLTE